MYLYFFNPATRIVQMLHGYREERVLWTDESHQEAGLRLPPG
jgi:hypothetical protein